VITTPYAELTGWMRAHRGGTPITVRIDPDHPGQPTVVGLGEPVDIDPVPGSVAMAALFAAIGLGAWWEANRIEVRVRATKLLSHTQ
jgi:hypothetical protein